MNFRYILYIIILYYHLLQVFPHCCLKSVFLIGSVFLMLICGLAVWEKTLEWRLEVTSCSDCVTYSRNSDLDINKTTAETKLSSRRWFFSSLNKLHFLSVRQPEMRQLGPAALKRAVYWIPPNVLRQTEKTMMCSFGGRKWLQFLIVFSVTL